MRIYVSPEDIDNFRVSDQPGILLTQECPVERAVKRQLNRKVTLPPEAVLKLRIYRETGKMEPFSFEAA